MSFSSCGGAVARGGRLGVGLNWPLATRCANEESCGACVLDWLWRSGRAERGCAGGRMGRRNCCCGGRGTGGNGRSVEGVLAGRAGCGVDWLLPLLEDRRTLLLLSVLVLMLLLPLPLVAVVLALLRTLGREATREATADHVGCEEGGGTVCASLACRSRLALVAAEGGSVEEPAEGKRPWPLHGGGTAEPDV